MANSWPAMEERGPQVSHADILAFEQRLGAVLVDDYREFLLEVNGGRLDEANTRGDFGVVNTVLSLNDPIDAGNLEVTNQYAADFPSRDLLEIAYDDGGGRILLALTGDHRGEVWLQVHEGRPPDSNPRVEPFRRRDMKRLADSFTDFMASLGPLKP